MLILSPHFNARLDALMLASSTADTSPCIGGMSVAINMGGVQLCLALVFRGGNVHFMHFSVLFASMVDNIVLKEKYFWML